MLPFMGSPEQALLHAKVYEIADKYDVPSLREYAKEAFTYACKRYSFDENFLDAVTYLYTAAPEHDNTLRIFCAGRSLATLRSLWSQGSTLC
jgi:hypothetical protein